VTQRPGPVPGPLPGRGGNSDGPPVAQAPRVTVSGTLLLLSLNRRRRAGEYLVVLDPAAGRRPSRPGLVTRRRTRRLHRDRDTSESLAGFESASEHGRCSPHYFFYFCTDSTTEAARGRPRRGGLPAPGRPGRGTRTRPGTGNRYRGPLGPLPRRRAVRLMTLTQAGTQAQLPHRPGPASVTVRVSGHFKSSNGLSHGAENLP
jgi:hypothetical protein